MPRGRDVWCDVMWCGRVITSTININGISQIEPTSWNKAFQAFRGAVIEIHCQRTHALSTWSIGNMSTSWSDFVTGLILLPRCCQEIGKYCEQQGDILRWDQSNKNYILTHGVSGIDWRFYPRPDPPRCLISTWSIGGMSNVLVETSEASLFRYTFV